MKRIVWGVAFAALAGYLAIRVYLCNTWIYDRDIANQERIGQGYVSFYRDRGFSPTCLMDIVNAGFLPARAGFYREPPSFWTLVTPAATSSCQVYRPAKIDFYTLSFIARRGTNGRWIFNPTVNAEIRDELMRIKRNEQSR